jgi:hypothetical protein
MSASTPVNPAASGLEVRTYFVRQRNALIALANDPGGYADLARPYIDDPIMGPAARRALGR